MPTIGAIINFLETRAPISLQESYDNSGLVCGDRNLECIGAITSLDLTKKVLEEAIEKKFNLIVVHHPPIFKALKKLDLHDPVTELLLSAVKHQIAIYAIHTNLDNVIWGVNGEISRRIGLKNIEVLAPLQSTHLKLVTFVPSDHQEKLINALFEAGVGSIGNYNECSFSVEGRGSFKPLDGSNPFIGKKGIREEVNESRMEMIFPIHLQSQIIATLHANHPYETVAYDILPLGNTFKEYGAGALGELEEELSVTDMLSLLKSLRRQRQMCIRDRPLSVTLMRI